MTASRLLLEALLIQTMHLRSLLNACRLNPATTLYRWSRPSLSGCVLKMLLLLLDLH